jgi:hypothetical protein
MLRCWRWWLYEGQPWLKPDLLAAAPHLNRVVRRMKRFPPVSALVAFVAFFFSGCAQGEAADCAGVCCA